MEIRLAQAASLLKPLIPLARIPEIAQKHSQHGRLALRDILKSSKMVETIPLKREKRRLSDSN
jgi:hypothetical protein